MGGEGRSWVRPWGATSVERQGGIWLQKQDISPMAHLSGLLQPLLEFLPLRGQSLPLQLGLGLGLSPALEPGIGDRLLPSARVV